ncbi:hypothetical protein ACLOJK_002927 [Asimina triloba]
MGNCAYTQAGRRTISPPCSPTPAKLILVDGTLREFHQPIRARHVTSDHHACFVCDAESMRVGSQVPHVEDDENLQPGRIYFLLPAALFRDELSLQQLCELAVKAGAALGKSTPAEDLPRTASSARRLWRLTSSRFAAVA